MNVYSTSNTTFDTTGSNVLNVPIKGNHGGNVIGSIHINTVSDGTVDIYSMGGSKIYLNSRKFLKMYERMMDKLDRQMRHFLRHVINEMEGKIASMVLERLSGEEPVGFNWIFPIPHMRNHWGRRVNVYKKVRYEATRRCYEHEWTIRETYRSRMKISAKGGRKHPLFWSTIAYGPKRSWMNGVPRRS